MKKAIFLFILLSLNVIPAFGQLDGNPENWCRNGFFPRESEKYKIGNIKAKKGERVYFLRDARKCPNDKNCQSKAYLVKDDEILVSRSYGNYVCVWYQPQKGSEVVGWLPDNKIEYPSFLLEKYDRWIGEWKYYDNTLRINRIGKTEEFEVSGEAFWKGLGDVIHIGEISAKGTLNESVIKLTEEDCEIKLKLIVDYLVVSDNLKCGGMNVTFSGVYLRKSTR